MKYLGHLVLCFFLLSSAALAAPANEDSIKQLLAVTKVRGTVDGLKSQLKDMMHKTVQQTLKGKVPTMEQQAAIENMEDKMLAVLQKELAWEKLEPNYVKLYQQAYSEDEVNGMLAFYRTPVGQAVVDKSPIVMQQMMLQMQEMQQRLLPEIRRVQIEFLSDLKALETKQ